MKHVSCLLSVASFLACAGLTAQPANKAAVVPIAADIETTQTTHLADGNILKRTVTARFFRDAAGRTRYEHGEMVSISDPVSRTALTLDVSNHAVTRINLPSAEQKGAGIGRSRIGAPNLSNNSMRLVADLGTKLIEGIEATGKEYVLTIPAGSSLGNTKPLERATIVWHSAALQMTLLVVVKDPIAGELVTAYKNIQTKPDLDSTLFRIPPGFTITEQVARAK